MKRSVRLAQTFIVAWAALVPMALAQQTGQDTALEVKASGGRTFEVKQRAGVNQVSVDSKSSMGKFTSVCNEVGGQFQLDPRHLETFAGRFSMPVSGIRTGIGLRDKHLRGPDWLDAAHHPDIVITIAQARDVRTESANVATMTLVGTCTMHGVTQPINVPATLAYLDESPTTAAQAPGNLVSIRCEFDVRLSDYNVKGSKMLGLKVQDTQRVQVAILAATAP